MYLVQRGGREGVRRPVLNFPVLNRSVTNRSVIDLLDEELPIAAFKEQQRKVRENRMSQNLFCRMWIRSFLYDCAQIIARCTRMYSKPVAVFTC